MIVAGMLSPARSETDAGLAESRGGTRSPVAVNRRARITGFTMNRLVHLLLLAHAGIIAAPAAPTSEPGYSQSYSVLLRGSPAGTESVTETTENDGSLVAVSEHEILISDGLGTKRMAFTTAMHLAKGTLAPIHYSYRYTSGDSRDFYEVSVKDGVMTRMLSRGGRTSEVSVPFRPEVVILDFSVYHQYDYLVRKYDFKRKGKQSFPNFIPLIGTEIPLGLTYLGDGKVEHARGSVPVRNFRIEFSGIWSGTFSTDTNGRLVRLQIPSQDLEVLRSDLLQDASRQPEPKPR